jgi:tyrosyl-tRNA synthetase
MMAKESVQKRLNGEARDGLSFTEFTYQLLQGYDFLYLYQHKELQTADGRKRTSGATSPRVRNLFAAPLEWRLKAFALTCPLITEGRRKEVRQDGEW